MRPLMGERSGPCCADLRNQLFADFRRSAQKAFIRADCAFLCAAVIGFRFRLRGREAEAAPSRIGAVGVFVCGRPRRRAPPPRASIARLSLSRSDTRRVRIWCVSMDVKEYNTCNPRYISPSAKAPVTKEQLTSVSDSSSDSVCASPPSRSPPLDRFGTWVPDPAGQSPCDPLLPGKWPTRSARQNRVELVAETE